MSWVKLDDRFANHPKVLEAGPLASWLYVCGLTYCSQYLTDGRIPKSVARRLADVENSDELAERLVAVGMWERTDDGYLVHDYLDYQPSRDEALEIRQVRQEAGRRGGLRSGQSRSEANEAKHEAFASPVASEKSKQNRTPYPSPSRSPDTDIDRDRKVDVAEARVRAHDGGGDVLGLSLCSQVAKAAHLEAPTESLALLLEQHRALGPPGLVLQAQFAAEWVADHKRNTNRKPMTLKLLSDWYERAQKPPPEQHPVNGGNGHVQSAASRATTTVHANGARDRGGGGAGRASARTLPRQPDATNHGRYADVFAADGDG